MSEGGKYFFKRRSGFTPKIADYSNLQNPLPEPPKGSAWFHDPKTREWKVFKFAGISLAINYTLLQKMSLRDGSWVFANVCNCAVGFL